MQISSGGIGPMSSIVKVSEMAGQSAMQRVAGAVDPVFISGKSGIVRPPDVDFGRDTFNAMQAGQLTYKKPGGR